jgi:hypothetical protein
VILLPQFQEWWDCRYTPPCPVFTSNFCLLILTPFSC